MSNLGTKFSEYLKVSNKRKYYVLLTLNLTKDQEAQRGLLKDTLEDAGWDKKPEVDTVWSKSFVNNESNLRIAEKMIGDAAQKDFESCLSEAGLDSVNAYLQVGIHPAIQLTKD